MRVRFPLVAPCERKLVMSTFFIIFAVVIYIVFVFVEVNCSTTINTKYHDGGFLGLGYITSGNREAEPRDVRRALIWPIIGVIFFVKSIVWILNDIVAGFLLIFNFNYKQTKLYQFIYRNFD